MEPILLIHGYGSEDGTTTTRDSVAKIYGDLPRWLRREYGQRSVFQLDLARYISLEDGIGLDDISRAMDRALQADFSHLLGGTFHVVIHSTGALVVRNWIRRFAPTNQPIRNLVYLAGANFGSGWAHVGQNRIARWGREVFTGGEAGVKVLQALELGSSETLNLHLHFLEPGQGMVERGVREFVIIGSQPSPRWFEFPIPYAKEDGSDGVVRVPGSNLNFSYARYEANETGRKVTSEQMQRDRSGKRLPPSADYYTRVRASIPGVDGREPIPFAIPYNTAHSGNEYGIVSGSKNRDEMQGLLKQALETVSVVQWRARREVFDATTAATLEKARGASLGGLFGDLKGWTRQAQYDAHSQIIVRLFDQDGRPVVDYDIYFGRPGGAEGKRDVADLIVDTHRNGKTKNVLTFFLRGTKWDREKRVWRDQLDDIDGVVLEIEGNEPQTNDIQYLPFRLELDKGALKKWIIPNTTTVVDIEMLRIPAADVFRVFAH
ncbi:MAG TPA: alpha/beta hydrolase [Acidimicrobiia bacterium]|nr:alpha/beta hydrolase [Acidimicrobiia bacterium]